MDVYSNEFHEENEKANTPEVLLPTMIMLYQMLDVIQNTTESIFKLDDLEGIMLIFIKLENNHFFKVSEIAENVIAEKSAVSERLNKLVATGIALRIDDEEDRRLVYTQLTAKGEEVALALCKEITLAFRNVFSTGDSVSSEMPDSYLASRYGECGNNIMLNDSDFASVFWLWQHYRKLRKMIRIRLREIDDMPEVAFLLLLNLAIKGQGVFVSDLSHFLMVSNSALSRALDFCTSRNYVKRNRSDFDRRKVLVDLTNEGYRQLILVFDQIIKETDNLSPLDDDNQKRWFAQYASFITDNARKH